MAMPVAVMVLPTWTPGSSASSLAMRLGSSWSTKPIAAFTNAGEDVGDDQVSEQAVAPELEREHEDAEHRHDPGLS